MTSPHTAIEAFDPTTPMLEGSHLLEASAGTGKTYSITNLVVRLVAEVGVPLREILVVTFTRAATSELRDRIRRRLTAALGAVEAALADGAVSDDPVLAHVVTSGRTGGREELRAQRRRLRAALESFDDASISTIHGFCQDTLRHSAFESDVDFDAELLENVDEVLDPLVNDLVVRQLRNATPDWYACLRAAGVNRGDLLDLARKVEAEPRLRILPSEVIDEPERAWTDAVASFQRTWAQTRDEVTSWLQVHRQGALGKKADYRDGMDDTFAVIDAWCGGVAARFADLAKKLPMYTTGELQKRLKGDYLDHALFNEIDRLLALSSAAPTAFKVRFARTVRDELARRKAARNVQTFTDLLDGVSRALEQPETRDSLASSLRHRYSAALIDEFQDTDPVQWQIFDTLFGEHGHLYLIGDPKQAIYAFRGADVHTYLRASTTVAAQSTLATNWRSDRGYVEALNQLFLESPANGSHAGGGTGPGTGNVLDTDGITYLEVDAAHDGDRLRGHDGSGAALRLVEFPTSLESDLAKKISKDWAKRTIPRVVASDVVEFLSSGAEIDDPADGWRAVLPRDIAVLTRTNVQAQQIQDALLEAGVQAVATGGGTVFETAEATTMLRLLNSLLRPHDDRAARAAVISPLLGVDATTLVSMTDNDWEDWLELLAGWSQRWREHGIAQALREVLDQGGRERLVRLPDGERRLTNVLHLAELLHSAERAERLGPTGLVAWLRERREDPRKELDATELRLESDEDAVTIVTIHRAKGLEYPVVWCPFLWEGSSLFPGENRNLRVHDPDADHVLTLDLDLDLAGTKAARVELARRETYQERLRLLYVALTRARHRCTVYWGRFDTYSKSPLGRVLHGFDGLVADGKLPNDDVLADQVATLVGQSDGQISNEVAEVPVEVARYVPSDRDEGELQARVFTRSVDRAWTRASFSSLVRDDVGHAAVLPVRDVDADLGAGADLAPGVAAEATDTEPVPLADFPRGAGPGTFLHDLLEHLDFTDMDAASGLEATVAEQLARHRVDFHNPAIVADALRQVVATPLGPLVADACLADVRPNDRLNELWFDLPLSGGYDVLGDGSVDVGRIADVFDRHAAQVPLLTRAAARLRKYPRVPVRGFLTGSIDLVMRHEVDGTPRFFVIDHKSNWHGDRGAGGGLDRSTVGHYHPARLADTMVDHDYLLQANLYVVALHRYLRSRLGRAYDYDRDVGGFLYLFLRGMVGSDTPRDEFGVPHGVFSLRSPRALIEDLDALLAGEQQP